MIAPVEETVGCRKIYCASGSSAHIAVHFRQTGSLFALKFSRNPVSITHLLVTITYVRQAPFFLEIMRKGGGESLLLSCAASKVHDRVRGRAGALAFVMVVFPLWEGITPCNLVAVSIN
jgi:hypothetical protein